MILTTSLNQLSTTNPWNKSIIELARSPKRPAQYLLTLQEAGIATLKDLIWLLPNRIFDAPKAKSFDQAQEDELFWGQGDVAGVKAAPAYGRRGKGKLQLFNITMNVVDSNNNQITLKFFNSYPSQVKSYNSLKKISFLGKISLFKGALQISNPNLNPESLCDENGLIVEYPTVAKIAGKFIKKAIHSIPSEYWDYDILEAHKLNIEYLENINLSFKRLHGIEYSSDNERSQALEKLVYYEFFHDQLKVIARKKSMKSIDAKIFNNEKDITQLIESFPYSLTKDQELVWKELLEDFKSGHPMMRMIQGDVGCGKTTIALMASLLVAKKGSQIALMCPTESLANQHYETFKEHIEDFEIELLVGSTKAKEKKLIYSKLESGDLKIVIGTHALIQDAVIFDDLQLAIIDEQHKFGVDQRLRLTKKGNGTHNLILTATPIPRTLQLAQYGDLDISSIKTMPAGRKGIKTRIVQPDTYQKYLSFIKTRLSMSEQIYIVAPAIEESETLNIQNVTEIEKEYQKFFPEYSIRALHGKLKSDEKAKILSDFKSNKVQMIISTTVIEVGINNPNATVMSIYNPDRFGLSSLHQLRGRVGRGEKVGFCFLVMRDKPSHEAIDRLKILEKTNDGFEIAQADLENRGEGDLFGTDQSGNITSRKVASIFEHFDLFNQVNKDVQSLVEQNNPIVNEYIESMKKNTKISTTI